MMKTLTIQYGGDSEEYHNDNHRASKEAWTAVKDIAKKELSNKASFRS